MGKKQHYFCFRFIYTIYCIQYFKYQLQCNLLFIVKKIKNKKCTYVLIPLPTLPVACYILAVLYCCTLGQLFTWQHS